MFITKEIGLSNIPPQAEKNNMCGSWKNVFGEMTP